MSLSASVKAFIFDRGHGVGVGGEIAPGYQNLDLEPKCLQHPHLGCLVSGEVVPPDGPEPASGSGHGVLTDPSSGYLDHHHH